MGSLLRRGLYLPVMLLVIAREQKPKGFVHSCGAGVGSARSVGCANPDVCWWDGGSRAELQEPSLASRGRAARQERWQQPGDGTSVLAGSPLLLKASVATERLCFSETFLSVELSLWRGRGEKK